MQPRARAALDGLRRTAVSVLEAGAPLGLFLIAVTTHDRGWREGIALGLGAGTALGLAWTAGSALRRWWRPPVHPAFPGEAILKADTANAFSGMESFHGWLYLTDRAVHFRSDRKTRGHGWSHPLASIQRAEARRTLFLIPNRLRLVLPGTTEDVVVASTEHKPWAAAITSAREEALRRAEARAGAPPKANPGR